jgi:hypothetical protein
VGFTSELDGLIFSAKSGARSGGYVVALDGELLDAIREVLERRDRPRAPATPAAPAPFASSRAPQGSALAPREIQARLRAGRRIEDVALEAGVDDDWVRRFATPVFAERAHVAARAQAAVLDVDGLGLSTESLGGSVAANLAERGEALTPDELNGGWDAYQLRETAWVVEFRPPLHTREQAARWGFDVRTGRLSALNPRANELGWVGPDGPAPSPFSGADDVVDEAADEAPHDAPEQLPLEPLAPRRPRRARAVAPVADPEPAPPAATPPPARRAGRARKSPPAAGGANGAGE